MRDFQNKGIEVELDKKRTIRYTLNSLIDLEERFGSITEVYEVLGENISMKDLRFLLYVGLKHEDKELTEEEVGELITFQDILNYVNLIVEGLSVSFPEVNQGQEDADDESKN